MNKEPNLKEDNDNGSDMEICAVLHPLCPVKPSEGSCKRGKGHTHAHICKDCGNHW